MDIGINQIVTEIASSTSSYLVTFSPLFLLVGGIILAFGIISALIGFVPKKNSDVVDFDFDLAEDLEDFYSKKGRSGARYDYDNIDDMI